MTANWRRTVRLLFKFGLLVSLPLAGYLWAQTGVSTLAIAMSAVCVVMALGAEGLASGAEATLSQLRAEADTEERAFLSEASSRDEKIRQMDRIVETLSNQNHDLRGKLVSLHGEMHRLDAEMGELLPGTTEDEPAAGEGQEETGGDITDLSSLRTRR